MIAATGPITILPVALFIFAASLYLLILGLRFRAGRLRGGPARWYFDDRAPFQLRRLAVASIPLSSIGFLMLLIVGGATLDIPWLGILSILLALFGMPLLMITTLVVMAWPPDFLKPDWVKERERELRK